MAEQWSQEISNRRMGKALKRIKFTKEKKTYGYPERHEVQRQTFLEQLRSYPPEQIVYVDEAGVDNTEDYAYGWCTQSQRF